MMAMVPTRLTYGLLLGGGVVATLLMNVADGPGRLGVALLTLALFDGVILIALGWDGLQARLRRAQVERSPLQRLSIGRDNPITLTCRAAQPTHLQIYDHYPTAFQGPSMPFNLSLSAAIDQTISFTVRPGQRGVYDWGDLRVRQRGPLGLAWADWRVPASTQAAVYPDLISLRQLSIRLALQSTGSLKQRRQLGVGTEFSELREYGLGDDSRLIDWKATARLGQPLVRVLEPEREQTLIILLDRGRLMTAQVAGLRRFDWGLNAALAMALAGISRGDRVGIGVFDRGLHTWLPPQGGQAHFQRMVERLTPIQPELLESDYLAALTQVARQQHRRALIVVVTDVVDATASAELLSALMRLRPRHLPFCVTLRDRQIDRQAHQNTLEVTQAFERAVALDLLAQREAAFTRLKHSGVMVLDAPADQISEPLVEAYLQIKLRGRL